MRKISDILCWIALALFVLCIPQMAQGAKDKELTRNPRSSEKGRVIDSDPFLPPDITMVTDIGCFVQHPNKEQPRFVVSCEAVYRDGRPNWSAKVAMFDPAYEGSFWKADKKAHSYISEWERNCGEKRVKAEELEVKPSK